MIPCDTVFVSVFLKVFFFISNPILLMFDLTLKIYMKEKEFTLYTHHLIYIFIALNSRFKMNILFGIVKKLFFCKYYIVNFYSDQNILPNLIT